MDKNRKTSHILNIVQYDANGHVVLPATLTVGENPHSSDNTNKIPSTSWVRTYVTGLSYQGALTLTATGSSGSATLVSNTLNVPTYTLSGLGGEPAITAGTTSQYWRGDKSFQTLNTTAVAEGTNLYYTQARFDTAFTAKSTTNLSEGTNLYYTTARVNSDFDTRLATKSTTNLAEGTNLYYTDARVGTYLTNNSYATQSYVSTQINNLVSGAPGLLDTLDELAAALGDDPNFATTVSTALSNRLRIDINTQGLTSTQQGYGRTNLGLGSLATLSSVANAQITDVAWSKVTGTPTTIAGYGITDSLVYTTSTYSNPAWITTLAWSKITGAPAFITSYTEVDTLATVTSRGATTTAGITVSGLLTATNIEVTTFATGNKMVYASGKQLGTLSGTDDTIAYWSGGTISSLLTATYPSLTELSYVKGVTSSIQTQLNSKLSSYTETDTLASVTGRGASTSTAITLSGAVNIYNTDSNDFRLYYQGAGSGSARIYYHQPTNELRIYATSAAPEGTTSIGSLKLYISSVYRAVLHEANYNSYSPTLTGSGASGTWGISITGSQVMNTTAVAENDAFPGFNQTASYIVTSSTGGGDGYIQAWRWTGGGYVTQFYTDVDPTGIFALRHRDSAGTWGSWYRLLHSGNISSYAITSLTDTLATVTGRGASTSSNVTFNGSVYLSGTYVQFPFTNADTTEWPYVRFGAADTSNGWDEGIIKANTTNGVFGRYGMGIHTSSSRAFGIYSSGWTKIIGFKSDEVRSYVNFTTTGTLTINGTGLDSPRLNMAGPSYTFIEMGDRTSGSSEVGYIKLKSNGTTTHDFTANSTELNYINNGGRFAIGDTSANGILHVKGSHVGGYGLLNLISSDNCLISMDTTSGADVRVRYKHNGVDKWLVGTYNSENYEIRRGDNALGLTISQALNVTISSGGLDTNTYLVAGSYLRHSTGTMAVTEYAGGISTPDNYPACNENARIYTIGTLNSGGGYNSFIEIEVFGSHRGYTPAGYAEYKKWIIWVGDRISSNLVASAGSDNNVGLWNGTNQYGLRGYYGDDVASGWVLKLMVNPSCGAGKNYTVKVKYSNLSMTHGPFTYTNHSSYSVDMPRSPHHTQWISTDGRQNAIVYNGQLEIPAGGVYVTARSSDTEAAVFKHPSNDYTIRSRASNGRDWAWYHSNDNFIFREPGIRTYMAFQHDNGKITLGNTDAQWDTQLRVHGNTGSAGYTTSDMNNIVHITRDSHAYIIFSSPDNYDNGIHFANTTDNGIVGRFAYFHRPGGDSMAWSVASDIRMNLTAGGTLTTSGDVVAYGSPSDARLKKVKEIIPNALSKVMSLTGYRFDWNTIDPLANIKEDVGVIAQEVQKVLPELARTNDDGFMSVRYQGLTAVLIEAVKEQQKQIEELKNKLDGLTK